MGQTLKINGVTYTDVKAFEVPLASDPSKKVTYPDTSDATAVAESVKNGDTFYADGKKVTGTMPVRSGGGTISTKDGVVNIQKGYHPGTGNVAIADTEKAKLIPANIRKDVTVLGVTGTMSETDGANPQAKTVEPTKAQQIIKPDTGSGYNYLSQVTVEPIPDEYITTTDATAEAEHIADGETAYVNGKKVVGTHTDPVFTLSNGVLSVV